ncbi:MAG: aminotransferase class I/II-fold pyridoxal phosphate-dependent enzyme [Anaerolineaceae bacterium]|nr:aminotransferase class I/II-fold pyridoxal phosphate-dependent enzyme [Anaerolineaceae bacterium]
MIQIAQRMQKLSPNFFANLTSQIQTMQAAGINVIRLDQGSPDLPPTPAIIAALDRSAASPGAHGYQPHRGTKQMRAAWAEMYRREYAVELDPETEVIPLLGSKEGIFHLITAFVDPGDVVLIPDPGYMTYTHGTMIAGGEPYYFPLRPENDYLPDLQEIPSAVLKRAKLLWLNYPNNPTTASATLEFFTEAVAFARQHNLLLCHDAAYGQVTFNGKNSPSLMQVPGAKEVAVEFNTLSKSHNMPGWRVGVVVGNTLAVNTLFHLKSTADSGHFQPIQDAAVLALTGDQTWLKPRNEIYRERRDVVIQGLQKIGLNPKVPDASIYVWSPVPEGYSSMDFVMAVLEKVHVSFTPGIIFGAGGEGYIRISLTAPKEIMADGMRRIAERL